MTRPAIEFAQVSKKYAKVQERSLLRSMIPFGTPNRSILWALRDVNLRIDEGETVGVIGVNGAGKSTLMRLLATVSQPSDGRVTIRGRIAPLLSVGVGFHQEMSGRENVYVNGMLLGLDRAGIAARFDEIVDFADLADFIDTPVKFYSTGMFMRLGFSVAIHVRPDVLLVDEVLAVGDTGFQLRCLNRMRELTRSGTTTVFVSHSMHAVQLLCPRVVVLQHGVIQYDGPTEEGIARYHTLAETTGQSSGNGGVEVFGRELLDDSRRPVTSVSHDQHLRYRMQARFTAEVAGPGVHFKIIAEDGTLAYSMQTPIGDRWRTYGAGEVATIEIDFRTRFGGGGTFHINVDVTDSDSVVLLGDREGPSFFVPSLLGVGGPADLGATISVDGAGRTDHTWERLVSPTGNGAMAAPVADQEGQ